MVNCFPLLRSVGWLGRPATLRSRSPSSLNISPCPTNGRSSSMPTLLATSPLVQWVIMSPFAHQMMGSIPISDTLQCRLGGGNAGIGSHQYPTNFDELWKRLNPCTIQNAGGGGGSNKGQRPKTGVPVLCRPKTSLSKVLSEIKHEGLL